MGFQSSLMFLSNRDLQVRQPSADALGCRIVIDSGFAGRISNKFTVTFQELWRAFMVIALSEWFSQEWFLNDRRLAQARSLIEFSGWLFVNVCCVSDNRNAVVVVGAIVSSS